MKFRGTTVAAHYDVPSVGDSQEKYRLPWTALVPFTEGEIRHGPNPGPFKAKFACWSIALGGCVIACVVSSRGPLDMWENDVVHTTGRALADSIRRRGRAKR